MELLEELQVVLEHQADVVDAVLQHGDALDANAEGEAGILIRVNVAVLQHFAVDNTAAQDFDPAGVLAQGAALAVALEAAHPCGRPMRPPLARTRCWTASPARTGPATSALRPPPT